MEKAGKLAEISDFDYTYYCNGNPSHCYYRKAESKITYTAGPEK